MSKLDRNQPPPFILLCALLVNLTLFMDSLSVGLTWGKIFHEAKGHPYHIYLELFIFLLYSVFLGLFFDICAILYNPFGPRAIDIPHHVVGRGIRELGMGLSKRETPITFDRKVNMRRRFSTFVDSMRDAKTLAFAGMEHAMHSNMKRQKQQNQQLY